MGHTNRKKTCSCIQQEARLYMCVCVCIFMSVYLAAMSRNHPDVSRDPVSSLHFNQISGHHFLSIDLYLLTLADHQRLLHGDISVGQKKTHTRIQDTIETHSKNMGSYSRKQRAFPSCHVKETEEFIKFNAIEITQHSYLQKENGNHQLCHLLLQYRVFTLHLIGKCVQNVTLHGCL